MTPATRARSAQEILAWGSGLTKPGLRDAVDSLSPSMRLVCGYHFGWWDAAGNPTEGAPGKALRPTLLLLCAEAAGASAADAVPGAVAVELVHNFSLIHDDVMDRDTFRRGRPTVWSEFGVGHAILAGDALCAASIEVLATSGHPAALAAVSALNSSVLRLISGQSMDLTFETRDDVGVEECRAMAQGKTGALLGCACELGGLLAAAPAARVAGLAAFGEELGAAFQLVDDILGIWGDAGVTGKPDSSDLGNRKKSLPVVAALSSGTPAGRELAELYGGSEPLSAAEICRARELVERAGARAWTESEADLRRDAALQLLEAAGLEDGAVTDLIALARLVTSRDR